MPYKRVPPVWGQRFIRLVVTEEQDAMYRAGILIIVVMIMLWSQAALAGQAQDAVKVSVDEVISILRDSKQGDTDRTKRLAQAVAKVFDPEELSKRTLASHWQEFSPEEQQKFTATFVNLLQKTYLHHLEAYTDERVDFLAESELAEDRAEVVTKIVTSGKDIGIIYRLIRKNSWKVYDVVIEGVSLVQNYRNQFAQILAKQSPAQLIGRLEAMIPAN
jgi:phospholipid transport system substrate-binding protein